MDLEAELLKERAELFTPKIDAEPEPEGLPMEVETGQRSAEDYAIDVGRFVKGLVTGAAGLPGDLLSIVRGVYEIGARGGDESKVDAFLRGMDEGLFAPTSDDINKWLNENVPMPEAMKRRGMTGTVGEFVAPGGAIVKGAKVAAKSIKGSKKAAGAIASSSAIGTIPKENKGTK